MGFKLRIEVDVIVLVARVTVEVGCCYRSRTWRRASAIEITSLVGKEVVILNRRVS